MQQKRYWLRGGVIGAVLAIIVIFVFVAGVFDGGGSLRDNIFIVLFLFTPIFLMAGIPQISIYFIGATLWFVIGAIIGWLYGKTKKEVVAKAKVL